MNSNMIASMMSKPRNFIEIISKNIDYAQCRADFIMMCHCDESYRWLQMRFHTKVPVESTPFFIKQIKLSEHFSNSKIASHFKVKSDFFV